MALHLSASLRASWTKTYMWKLFMKHFCHTFTLLFLRLILTGQWPETCVQICSRLLGQQRCQLVENSCRVTRFESNWKLMAWTYIRRVVKPKTKDELVNGILAFWATVDVAKCRKYIRHLKKVIPRVIELEGWSSNRLLDFCEQLHYFACSCVLLCACVMYLYHWFLTSQFACMWTYIGKLLMYCQ